MVERLSPSECVQLKNRTFSCDGCPIYKLAQQTLSVSPLNDRVVAELAAKCCPENARMNIDGLGLAVLPVETPLYRRSRGFVR